MSTLYNGEIVVLEGLDCTGKSTLINNLLEQYEKQLENNMENINLIPLKNNVNDNKMYSLDPKKSYSHKYIANAYAESYINLLTKDNLITESNRYNITIMDRFLLSTFIYAWFDHYFIDELGITDLRNVTQEMVDKYIIKAFISFNNEINTTVSKRRTPFFYAINYPDIKDEDRKDIIDFCYDQITTTYILTRKEFNRKKSVLQKNIKRFSDKSTDEFNDLFEKDTEQQDRVGMYMKAFTDPENIEYFNSLHFKYFGKFVVCSVWAYDDQKTEYIDCKEFDNIINGIIEKTKIECGGI